MNIYNLLIKYQDLDYQKFQAKICHTNYKIIGVKIPIIRQIAKDLLKRYPYQEILKNVEHTYFEEIMLEGLIISNTKEDLNTLFTLIQELLPYIDNWAICDILASELKICQKYPQEFLQFINKIIQSTNPFSVRLGIVLLLNYYINDEYIDLNLKTLLTIQNDYYYVKMAISWNLSFCLIKYFSKTIDFLEKNKTLLDKWIYNKTLQKAIESYQINAEQKNILRNMKI